MTSSLFKLGRKSRIQEGWFLRRLRERPLAFVRAPVRRGSSLVCILRLYSRCSFTVLGGYFDFANNLRFRFLIGCKLQYNDDHPVLGAGA
jgi:hypothetical protein